MASEEDREEDYRSLVLNHGSVFLGEFGYKTFVHEYVESCNHHAVKSRYARSLPSFKKFANVDRISSVFQWRLFLCTAS